MSKDVPSVRIITHGFENKETGLKKLKWFIISGLTMMWSISFGTRSMLVCLLKLTSR